MLSHPDLAAYVAALTDEELQEFAARVVCWRKSLAGDEAYYWPLMRAFVAAHNGFGSRGWNAGGYLKGNNGIDPQSPWGRAHARAKVLRADCPPEKARKQVAAWAKTVQLRAA